MKQAFNMAGLNIVGPSNHKRLPDERFIIDPLQVNQQAPSLEYSKRVAQCCSYLLEFFPNHLANVTSVIPASEIAIAAKKYNVSVIKVKRILNHGKGKLKQRRAKCQDTH